MAELKSELTWSFSRDRLFRECRRAYYFNYYASWSGWDEKADLFVRKAYILKNIQNVDAWIGDIVHQLLKWIIENRRQKKIVTYEEAARKAKAMLRRTWEQSRSRAWMKKVKHNLNLFEHYYDREPSREELAPRLQKVVTSLHSFYDSGLLEKIDSLPRENILAVDVLDFFELEKVKIFAAPDFALRDKGCVLYDWKTGKPSDKDIQQLSCYVLYALEKWHVPQEEIKVVPVYLAEDNCSLSPVQPHSPAEMKEFILESIGQMRAVLYDPAVNKADPELCPKTEEPWRCKNCRFQEICS